MSLVRASGNHTPQFSPQQHQAIRRAQDEAVLESFVGTPERLSQFRSLCLERDRHRCLITHGFDIGEWDIRWERDGLEAKDDDGNLLMNEPSRDTPCTFEAAYILPHALSDTKESSIVCSSLYLLHLYS